ncbi:MAG: AAA family ATPase [Deltaproteobacteria bacterium]|nr:AAA family ATPase [Deltaproteobacteria bacterium]
MQKDSENMSGSPFQDGNELESFFAGGGRGELLSELQTSVMAGVPLFIVTGDDGSGKTTICTVLEQKLAAKCVVVNFPQTVESFEDVVRIISRKLGIATTEITDGKELRGAIGKIAEFLLENRSHLLVIFDEAENIYLATLERIRKMLGQMTDAGVYLHVLFSGKSSFLENYDQLIICDFKQVEEFHSVLGPLTERETAEYLQSRRELFPGGASFTDIFPDTVVAKMHAIAKGNFSMINVVAEDFTTASSGDSFFQGEVENIPDDMEGSVGGWKDFFADLDIRRFWPFLPWVGGSLSILLVLLLVFGTGNGPEGNKDVPSKESMTENVEGEPAAAIVPEETADLSANPQEVPVVTGGELVSPAEEAVQDVGSSGEIVTSSEKTDMQEEPDQVEPESEQENSADNDLVKDTVAGVVEDTATVRVEQHESKKQEIEIEPIQEKESIVELRQSPPLKKKVGTSGSTKNKIVVRPRKEVQKVTAVNKNFTVDQLYSRRVAAGREWKYGVKDNMYTIQLMSLTSKNAVHNLKLMLAQGNYRRESGNFFIFRTNSSPTALLVFYGEYPTITEARRVLKLIPSFLRMHKPYAISIKGAVAKVKK